MTTVPNDILAVLRRGGLLALGTTPKIEPLAGGVSSDIWRVDLDDGAFCVKRALPELKVKAHWTVPVERSRYEAMWMEVAAAIVPDSVPALIHNDAAGHALVMRFLDPIHYKGYKALLMEGSAVRWMAERVAERLVAIHNATADDASIESRFATDAIFHDIRIEPYLLATAQNHPPLAPRLRQIAETTSQTKRALVHGDISPKNILIGAQTILFLDAECAWYGDPAFDLAFCLNHFLLKAAFMPDQIFDLLDFFEVMSETYLKAMQFEPRDEFEARTAALLPGLTLGRIDGRSPVEYICDDELKNAVRDAVRPLIEDPLTKLSMIQDHWLETFAA